MEQTTTQTTLITSKTNAELIEMVYSQRVYINKLEFDLSKEKEQVAAIIDDVMPIVQEIKESNKFLRFVKIVKLAFVLVDTLIKWTTNNTKPINDAK